MNLFDTYWTDALRSLMPWAEPFFRAVTLMGSEFFYLVLIAIGYWALNKKASILTTFVLTISVVSNYWLKIIIRYPRPPATNCLPGVKEVNYSLPSGHAQSSTTFWGWLGAKMKKWWMIILSATLIVLIGLSRVYVGAHWMADVATGWATGLFILIIILRLEVPIQSFLSRFKPASLYLGLTMFGLVAMILTESLSPVTIVGLKDNFGGNGGLIMGLGVGLALESKYAKFEVTPKNGEKWRVALRVITGLILVTSVMVVLSPILPSEIYWLRSIRYSLTTIIVIFLWPLIFKKLGL